MSWYQKIFLVSMMHTQVWHDVSDISGGGNVYGYADFLALRHYLQNQYFMQVKPSDMNFQHTGLAWID